MINTILFDLDGTLLPLDIKHFMQIYLNGIADKLEDSGIERRQLMYTILEGTDKMTKNDGSRSNEDLFWDHFLESANIHKKDVIEQLDDFYLNDFKEFQVATKVTPYAKECVDILKEKGYKLVLATNPLFPRQATLHRLQWAGLKEDDFILITTYEDFHYAKPNPEYFKEILEKIGKDVSECMMIGNDVQEDLVVEEIGMPCYLITDGLINRDQATINGPHGSFKEFIEEIKTWPNIK